MDTQHAAGFVGDELSASGYRLAGARVWIAEPAGVVEAFEQARTACRVVLITTDLAARLPARVLGRARASVEPLVLVVPGAAGADMPDLAEAARRQLGIET